MDLNALIEIVISLAALFWLLSTVCSFFVEAVNSMVRNVRADALERFVCEMILGDGKVQTLYKHWKGRLSRNPQADPMGLLSHGLIESLRKPSKGAGGDTTAPSYVPAEVFAKVLLDRLVSLAAAAGHGLGDCADLLEELGGAASPLGAPWQARFAAAASGASQASGLATASTQLVRSLTTSTPAAASADLAALKARLVASARGLPNPRALAHLVDIIDALDRALAALPAAAANPTPTVGDLLGDPETAWLLLMRTVGTNAAGLGVVDAVRAMVDHAPLPRSLREALRPIVANANFDLAQIRKGIEDWYNGVMERASGWFKRNTTWWLGGCGLLAAIVFNINPFAIAQDLVKDPALRRAGVALANELQEQKGDVLLARKFAFARAERELHWQDRIKTEALKPSPDPAEIKKLALEIQPFLLRSGQLAGLVPTVRQPVESTRQAVDWKTLAERKQFLDLVCTNWYEAQVSAGRVAKDAKPPVDITGCPSLAEHFGPAQARAETTDATQVTTLSVTSEVGPAVATPSGSTKSSSSKTETVKTVSTKSASAQTQSASAPTRNADAAKFWSSGDLVWNTGLATALWNAQLAAQGINDVALPEKPYAALKAAFDDAKTIVDEVSKRVDAFLDRIPSLGWRWDPTIDSQANLGAYWRKVMYGALFGWPVTALMVSFGAAFWFDLLSKLMNRRVTGPRPDTVS